MTEKHIETIAPEILLDIDEMHSNPKSPFALTYLADQFRSEDLRHSVDKLLRLGWLLCHHESEQAQEDELWYQISPEMTESISKAEMLDFVHTLTQFSICINKQFIIVDE